MLARQSKRLASHPREVLGYTLRGVEYSEWEWWQIEVSTNSQDLSCGISEEGNEQVSTQMLSLELVEAQEGRTFET